LVGLVCAGQKNDFWLEVSGKQGWADAFCNVVRDISTFIAYTFIADGRDPVGPRPPAFAAFENGCHAACIVDAVLESRDWGGAWTAVQA
jgi:hypothetical protein